MATRLASSLFAATAAATAAAASSSSPWAPAPPAALVFTGGGDFFGSSVAWGAPGGRELLVSRPGAGAGRVDLLRRANTSSAAPWGPASTIVPSLSPPSGPCDGTATCSFGAAIATAANGTLLAVGAPGANDDGSVFVWRRSSPATPGKTWTLVQTLTFPGPTSDSSAAFGSSLAWSDDGRVLLVGAPSASWFAGAAYVFLNSRSAGGAGTWTKGARIAMPDPTATDAFGSALALTRNGTAAVIGAPGWSNACGRAYVFDGVNGSTAPAGAPELVNVLDAPPGAKPSFGAALSLLELGGPPPQGQTLPAMLVAAGSPGVSYAYSNGSAFVFASPAEDPGQPWDVIVSVSRGADETDEFGAAVALHSDRATGLPSLLVGAPDAGNGEGGVWVYGPRAAGAPWTLQTTLLPSSNAPGGSAYGQVLALWANVTKADPAHPGLSALLAVGAPMWGSYRGAVGTYGWAADGEEGRDWE
jgi:hypothetical protein